MLKLAPRLRLFQDDSATHVTQGGRVPLEENTKAALIASAGANHVKVGHFSRFQLTRC